MLSCHFQCRIELILIIVELRLHMLSGQLKMG